MFDKTLALLTEPTWLVQPEGGNYFSSQWLDQAEILYKSSVPEQHALLLKSCSVLGVDILSHTEGDCVIHPRCLPLLITLRCMPNNNYYKSLGRTPPVPGSSKSVGLSLDVDVLCSHLSPSIEVSLSIEGEHELRAFGHFYQDWRKVIELLFLDLTVRIEGAARYKTCRGINILKLLDEIYKGVELESYFSINYVYYAQESDEKLYYAYLIFSALYDACYHYSKKRKNYDRILHHYLKIAYVRKTGMNSK